MMHPLRHVRHSHRTCVLPVRRSAAPTPAPTPADPTPTADPTPADPTPTADPTPADPTPADPGQSTLWIRVSGTHRSLRQYY
eukprot:1689778-Rhodomonas_salina.3